MAHLDDNRVWSLNAKATLELEIEQGYQDIMKDCPLGEPKYIIMGTKEAGIKRLSDMYEDPEIGPDVFLKTTKLIKICLRLYRLSKDNPTLPPFLHCSTPAPGVILHFNSVAAKKEIFVLLPSGDQPRQKPLKVQVAHIIRWYQDRMTDALYTVLKERRAKRALLKELNKIRREQNEATRFIRARLTSIKEDSKLKRKFKEDGLLEYVINGKKERKKLRADFDALNPRMYREKQFMQMKIDHFKNLTKRILDVGKLLQKFLSDL